MSTCELLIHSSGALLIYHMMTVCRIWVYYYLIHSHTHDKKCEINYFIYIIYKISVNNLRGESNNNNLQ